jgi:hypothetical protein
MATEKTKTPSDRDQLLIKVGQLRGKILETRLNIKAGTEKNFNAHKPLKRELAQLLTKLTK